MPYPDDFLLVDAPVEVDPPDVLEGAPVPGDVDGAAVSVDVSEPAANLVTDVPDTVCNAAVVVAFDHRVPVRPLADAAPVPVFFRRAPFRIPGIARGSYEAAIFELAF